MPSILYIFPHPDDESFGPAPVLAKQRREGHDVHLLTLTRGEATTQRERLGYSKAEMAAARYEEMQNVAEALDLTSLSVLEYPDGELAELNPLMLEDTVEMHIHRTTPDVVVTYPVHGISGHPDHLVSHAVVKRVVSRLWADGADAPARLAFFTLGPPDDDADRPAHLTHSPESLIDVHVDVTPDDVQRGHDALDCYVTYRPVIEKHQPLSGAEKGTVFELFSETHRPRLKSLTEGME